MEKLIGFEGKNLRWLSRGLLFLDTAILAGVIYVVVHFILKFW